MSGLAKINATRIGYDPYTITPSVTVCLAPGGLPISSSQLSSLSNPIKYVENIYKSSTINTINPL